MNEYILDFIIVVLCVLFAGYMIYATVDIKHTNKITDAILKCETMECIEAIKQINQPTPIISVNIRTERIKK